MGYGDDVIATGFARKVPLNKRVALGANGKILWAKWSEQIFRNNPRIARPGQERDKDLQWVDYYKGHRIYNTAGSGRWIWNYHFKVTPGEMYFSDEEKEFAEKVGKDFILLEPNLPLNKPVTCNKDWGQAKYQAIADSLRDFDVVQFDYDSGNYPGVRHLTTRKLEGVRLVKTASFRLALAAMSRARLAVLPEGGMHHSAAAVGV